MELKVEFHTKEAEADLTHRMTAMLVDSQLMILICKNAWATPTPDNKRAYVHVRKLRYSVDTYKE